MAPPCTGPAGPTKPGMQPEEIVQQRRNWAATVGLGCICRSTHARLHVKAAVLPDLPRPAVRQHWAQAVGGRVLVCQAGGCQAWQVLDAMFKIRMRCSYVTAIRDSAAVTAAVPTTASHSTAAGGALEGTGSRCLTHTRALPPLVFYSRGTCCATTCSRSPWSAASCAPSCGPRTSTLGEKRNGCEKQLRETVAGVVKRTRQESPDVETPNVVGAELCSNLHAC